MRNNESCWNTRFEKEINQKKLSNKGSICKETTLGFLLLQDCQWQAEDPNLRKRKKHEFTLLNNHTLKTLDDDKSLTVRSFTLTENSLSLSIAKEIPETTEIKSAVGIDRNLRNLAVGNPSRVTYYDTTKIVEIGETTKDIIRSFKRNDVRIRREIASKYGRRKKQRVGDLLNKVSKDLVERALEAKSAIIFENVKHIRSMYRKGNYQGKGYRRQMNNYWPFGEIKRQIEYKAQSLGVPIIHLTKSETRGTSSNCYVCGERLQSSSYKKRERQLWCRKCEKWFDRDLVAVMNISRSGWVRFAQSQNKGIGTEPMLSESETTTVIRKVDPMKSSQKERLAKQDNPS
jgi:putative transposase